jgi:Kef-type K+ transport system membrane component KefB
MPAAQFGHIALLLFAFLATAHILGHVFARLRQPRVIGEICAGLFLGPSILGHFAPQISTSLFGSGTAAQPQSTILGFVYELGLLLLMFASGAETRQLFGRDERRQVTWLATVGTGLPFLIVLAVGAWLPLQPLMGAANQRSALLLVVGIAVAVTSIPVISRIFHDLKILHTRFARLVLGVAVVEDIALWAVLAVALAIAKSGSVPQREIVQHVAATLIYLVAGLTLAPRLLRRIARARWNILAAASPIGYLSVVLFFYVALAAALNVSTIFAAFLAGFAVAEANGGEALESLQKVSFGLFIPIYFAIVGFRLDLAHTFSLTILGTFMLAACALKLISVAVGARAAGFRGLDAVNLAIATNARGGPGIVLASVAFDAGIINATFYTTLVLMAVLTSQAAGVWLEFVLRRGWPLLSAQPATAKREPQRETAPQLAA